MVKLVCYNIEYCEGMPGHTYQYLEFWRMFFPPKNISKDIAITMRPKTSLMTASPDSPALALT